tara:strand:- start:466 stop:723 length:258 start_codon:yes stop_codon:yes gene_type:complete
MGRKKRTVPLHVNVNPFKDPKERKRFLDSYKKHGGIAKACRQTEIAEALLRVYVKEGKLPDKEYEPNRQFTEAIEVIKQSLRKKG